MGLVGGGLSARSDHGTMVKLCGVEQERGSQRGLIWGLWGEGGQTRIQ